MNASGVQDLNTYLIRQRGSSSKFQITQEMKSEQFKTLEMNKKNHLASNLCLPSGLVQFIPAAAPQPASGHTDTQLNVIFTVQHRQI